MASAPKIQKTESNGKVDQDQVLNSLIEKIDEVQSDIDKLNEQASEEILEVEKKFNQKRQPLFQQRANLIKTIPNFWINALSNHPQLMTLITEHDEDLLQSLTSLDVEEFDDIKSGFKIIMTFSPNEYFNNSTITKSIHVGESEIKTTCDQVDWKDGKNFVKSLNESINKTPAGSKGGSGSPISFMQWFTSDIANSMVELGEVIKDDLWPNPLQYYLAVEDDEDEEGADDEDLDEEADDGCDDDE